MDQAACTLNSTVAYIEQERYMQCEKCNSENTQRLQVVYEGGTQNIHSVSHTAGAGIGSGGYGGAGATTTTSGVSRSILANRAMPPLKRSYQAQIIFGFLALVIMSLSLSGESKYAGIRVFAMAVFALCVYTTHTAYKFNSTVWPGQYKFWQAQWLCHKCGHIYFYAH